MIDHKSPALGFFRQAIQKEDSLLVESLWDAPKAALIEIALEATQKTLLIITGGTQEQGNRLLDDLPYFGIDHALEFPSWETLPGEEIPPSPDIVGKRFEILELLLHKKQRVLFASLQACLQKVVSPKRLKTLCLHWKRGEEVPFHTLTALLQSLDYRRSPIVADKGDFALRGGILDLFPLSSPEPFRIEFFGDVIEEIRIFDPVGQKSIRKVNSLSIVPASESLLLQREEKRATLLDYLGEKTLVIFDDLLSLEDRYASLKKLSEKNSSLLLSCDALLEEIAKRQRLYWTKERAEELSTVAMPKKIGRSFYSGKEPLQPLSFEMFQRPIQAKRWNHPFFEVRDFFSPTENRAAATQDEILHSLNRFKDSPLELHFISSTESEERLLREKISAEKISLPQKTLFERGYLSSGFCLADGPLALIPLTEFTRRYRVRRQKWRSTYHTPASEFHELLPGDIVVHFHQGIAKFLGIEERPNHEGVKTEFLLLAFAEGGKLYVPITQSHLITRYIGAGEEIPTLNVLGTQKWQRTKERAQKAIVGYAQELLQLAAQREIAGGFPCPEDSPEMVSFENDFSFVETEDQLRAIADIKRDLSSSKAMDRLICGDVGYGKTEVAMRAAFKTVVDGKRQVALLVPTTVLALQHYETFSARMANFPVTIAVLSRFQSPKEIKNALQGAKEGSVDILIGTHRLISRDVYFKNLGLIVIDEEQRFGVRAKERIKSFKVGVDCLTLSATPIPRTLYLSLMGAREISTINTPPQDRLPIKTIISERDPTLIQNALLRELTRDGQAFFIHNRVESIFKVAHELQALLPQANIIVGHGQMSSDEIETVFHSFQNGSADILVATTIIENGIDISNANTILVDRADQFGLADLYQLRGRVGRSDRPAYAYFLTPSRRALPELTHKRLRALVEASSGHGGGMKIAMRDLEIRGAGDILGAQQSGQISTIGFHFYCKLLKRTIDSLRKKRSPSFLETKIEISFNASLPESYIAESSLRMEIYHRLGESTLYEDIEEILRELHDRFGPPPPPVLWLIHLTRLRLFAAAHRFTLLKFEKHSLTAEQQGKKELVKKRLPLPSTKNPQDFEKTVTALLEREFTLNV
jgi:transcription-repair coupling factor (superfamily II helicase)